MKRNESDFQEDVLHYLNKQRIWHKRTQMGMDSGLPDIIAIVNGVFVGIELKREDGKGNATLQQLKVLSEINEAGACAQLISSMEELVTLIDTVRASQRNKVSLDIPKEAIEVVIFKAYNAGTRPEALVRQSELHCPTCDELLANHYFFLPSACPRCKQRIKRKETK